jgi:hypothetical protein
MALQSITALASITLQQAGASVTFSNIPQNYRDLILTYAAIGSSGQATVLELNGSSANASQIFMFFSGSTVGAGTDTFLIGGAISTSPGVNVLQFFDYSSTDKHKTYLIRSDRAADATIAYAARWAQTAAINSIRVSTGSGNFSVGSTFNLYGRIA